MSISPLYRAAEPVFAWKSAGVGFALYDAKPVAPGRPVREQIRLGREMLAAAPSGWKLAGAFPFDFSESGSLWIGHPESLRSTARDEPGDGSVSLMHLTGDADRDFVGFAHAALEQLDLGNLSKVVACRRFRVRSRSPFQPIEVFSRLSSDGAATAFLCMSRGGTLVGASPETLVQKQGFPVSSTPLAGSRNRVVDDPAWAAETLLRSEKDLLEHRLVVDEILIALRLSGVFAVEGTPPFIMGTERMWHLATDITGLLPASDTRDSMDLVELLHPTPAVCGTPVGRAFEYIKEHEMESRGLYSGAVGWQLKNGDGEWRVTLRCGLLDGDTAHVTSGAGLVAGSTIDEELSEAKQKAMTFVDALSRAPERSNWPTSEAKEK